MTLTYPYVSFDFCRKKITHPWQNLGVFGRSCTAAPILEVLVGQVVLQVASCSSGSMGTQVVAVVVVGSGSKRKFKV